MCYLDSSAAAVRLWTQMRLPLSPAGQMLEAKRALCRELRCRSAPSGMLLLCSYWSQHEGFFDVENVLIYNVGTGAFAEASRNGIAFERVRKDPPPAPNGNKYAHLSEYRFVPIPTGAKIGAPQISFTPGRLASPFQVWWAATAAHTIACEPIGRGAYSLHIELAVPMPPRNPGSALKRLVDGVIASMHPDAEPDLEATARLGRLNRIDPAIVAERLRLPPNPLLPVSSRHRVVRPYRDGVQWYPMDGRCERCALIVLQSPDPKCTVSISMLELQPTTSSEEYDSLRSLGRRTETMPSNLSNFPSNDTKKGQVHKWAKRPEGVTAIEIGERLNIDPNTAAKSLIGDLRRDGYTIVGRRNPADGLFTYYSMPSPLDRD